MIDANGDVLYVGKAKNIKKRITAYARPTGHDTRIERMIAATATLEFVSTATETEALLLEANLIKRLRPRFNVLLRDDKSFPYILITSDHWAPQILKHRGARTRPGHYYGPFASVGRSTAPSTRCSARSCSARARMRSSKAAPGRACSIQIKRCSAPCTREIEFAGYAELVREANAFLSGKSRSGEGGTRRRNGEGVGRARFRTRRDLPRPSRGAVGHPVAPGHQSARRRGGRRLCRAPGRRLLLRRRCSSSAPGRTGATAPISPRPTARSAPARCWRVPGAVLRRQAAAAAASSSRTRSRIANCWREALSAKSGRKVEVCVPQRGEKKDLVAHALANAREALGRKLAETSSQQKLLQALAESLRAAARRRAASRSTTTATSRARTRSAP